MYAAYFNLNDNPFAITPDPAYLYLSHHHQEALGHLLYGTGEDGGFVQLTGEVGTGKTTVIRALLKQDMPSVDVALCLNPRLTVEEFLASICDELKISYPATGATLKTLVDALSAHLLNTHGEGRRTVLIIDEAQNLSREVLEQVRLLTNLETHRHKLLRIILVGQPELQEMLARRDMRQLAQRITARFHLRPLTRAETAAYITHRLAVAGGRSNLFTPAAVRAVHRRAHGIPRLVNIICDRALLGAYSQNRAQVDVSTVRRAAQEALGGFRLSGFNFSFNRQLAAGLTAGVVAGILLWLATQGTPRPATTVKQPVAAQAPPAATVATVPALQEPALPDDMNGAMQRMLRVWNRSAAIPAGTDPCSAASAVGLRCFSAYGGMDDLRRFNLPAILQVQDGSRGGRRQVLLRGLSGDEATLESSRGVETRRIEDLQGEWTGDYVLLWQPPVSGSRVGARSRGEDVLWLRRQLALAAGEPATSQPLSDRFDSDLGIRLRTFQARHGLATDGVAGTRTLIVLANQAPAPGTPQLLAPVGQKGG